MLQSVRSLAEPALLERLTLLLNHVLAAEPVAVQRLCPHAGKRLHIELVDWPSLLPAPPAVVFQVTPAGLLEWPGDAERAGGGPAELQLRVAAANPALLLVTLLAGDRPDVAVQGEAQFATDVQWLADNLRWDLEADLARLIGPLPARQLARLGAALVAGLRRRVPPAAATPQGPAAQ
jgi:ubiquinone biosynthesis accessory factor UbiJ